MCRYLTCPERFRLLVVDGLRPPERFVAPIEFGNMWHTCEEALAGFDDKERDLTAAVVDDALTKYVKSLMNKFPHDRDEVAQWYDKCRALFPLYVEHWSRHPDVAARTPLLSEQAFDVPYCLPSGRAVRLRGKWDSVDLVDGAVWLQENKTKSGIDRQAITRQLTFDLQTMIYVVALGEYRNTETILDGAWNRCLIKGVRYNVVRRSAHKGSAGKTSAAESMLKKYHEDAAAGRVGEWFARWNVEVSPEDVARFRARCLDPLLDQLCSWWNYVSDPVTWHRGRGPADPWPVSGDVVGHAVHYQRPFGVKNYLDDGGHTDLDECVTTGSTVGLHRVTNMFPELQEV